jgi:predicted ATPase
VILSYRRQGIDLSRINSLVDEEINLDRISAEALTHLVEILLGGTASSDLISLVMNRSEGNPYFAEQIVRYMQEENLLEMSAEGWRPVKHKRLADLPGDIRALLVARLDQLPRQIRDVVQTASVLGREFDIRVLMNMLAQQGDTFQGVTEAEKAAIWFPLQESRYIFYHGLLRDAAYSMQIRARQQELHAAALRALETIHAENISAHFSELAYHAERGNLPLQAMKYYALAGRVAAESYQNTQAITYYTRALAYTPFNDLPSRFDLIAERVELYARLGKRNLQLKDLNTLERLAAQMQDHVRLAKVTMLRSAYHYFTGNYLGAIECARITQTAPQALASSDLGLYTQVVWVTALLRLGRLEEAMQIAKAALKLARDVNNRRQESRILNIMGWVAIEQQDLSGARIYLSSALEIARAIKALDVESHALINLAMLEGYRDGNYALARQYYEQALHAGRAAGNHAVISVALNNLGFVAGMQGDFDSARSYYQQALAMGRESGNVLQEIYTLINLSALDGNQQNAESAYRNAELAANLARKVSDRSGEAWAMHYLGHACLQQGKYEAARNAYRVSIQIRNELNQKGLSMEPLAGLAASYLEENNLAAAAEHIESILNFLAEGNTLEGAEEPIRVLHTCYLYLNRKGDPRAEQILQQAVHLLETQVSRLTEEAERKRYIENIRWRRAVWEAAYSTAAKRKN